MIVGLCERFGCLPEPGGLLDQPADFLRMIRLHDLAHPREENPGAE
jgi:hypothetical protein